MNLTKSNPNLEPLVEEPPATVKRNPETLHTILFIAAFLIAIVAVGGMLRSAVTVKAAAITTAINAANVMPKECGISSKNLSAINEQIYFKSTVKNKFFLDPKTTTLVVDNQPTKVVATLKGKTLVLTNATTEQQICSGEASPTYPSQNTYYPSISRGFPTTK